MVKKAFAGRSLFQAFCAAGLLLVLPLQGGAAQGAPSDAKENAPHAEKAQTFSAGKLAPATQEELAALRRSSEAYGKKDYTAAIAILTPFAEAGSARAAFSLGLMAMRGHGMPMSTEVAERWWTRSAAGGFPEAQYQLGLIHHQGLRGPRDPEFIARLWTLAAASGQGDAMFALGFMYRAGDGVPMDLKKSEKMFTDAARLGHPGAAYELGLMYRYGRGGAKKDEPAARRYFEQAAKAGVREAKQELAKK